MRDQWQRRKRADAASRQRARRTRSSALTRRDLSSATAARKAFIAGGGTGWAAGSILGLSKDFFRLWAESRHPLPHEHPSTILRFDLETLRIRREQPPHEQARQPVHAGSWAEAPHAGRARPGHGGLSVPGRAARCGCLRAQPRLHRAPGRREDRPPHGVRRPGQRGRLGHDRRPGGRLEPGLPDHVRPHGGPPPHEHEPAAPGQAAHRARPLGGEGLLHRHPRDGRAQARCGGRDGSRRLG